MLAQVSLPETFPPVILSSHLFLFFIFLLLYHHLLSFPDLNSQVQLATLILLLVFMISHFYWFSFCLSTVASPSHSLLLVLPLLFNLSVRVSECLVPRPLPFLSCHPHSLSCTQPNPVQTHVLLSPKFLMAVLTFFSEYQTYVLALPVE